MKWPTLEQLRDASSEGSLNYFAEQEKEVGRCLASWLSGVNSALRSVLKEKPRTFQIQVGPGGSFSAPVVCKARRLLDLEVSVKVPGLLIVNPGAAACFVASWDPFDLGLK